MSGREREQSINRRDRFRKSFALIERIGEIRQYVDMLRLDRERGAETGFGAIGSAHRLVADTEVVEQSRVSGRGTQCALVMDGCSVVHAVFAIEIAKMKGCLGIFRVEARCTPPGCARGDRIGAIEDFAKKVPGWNERGIGLEQLAQQRFRGRGLLGYEGKLLRLLQQGLGVGVGRRHGLSLQRAMAVLVALAAAAGAGRIARRGWKNGGGLGHGRAW